MNFEQAVDSALREARARADEADSDDSDPEVEPPSCEQVLLEIFNIRKLILC